MKVGDIVKHTHGTLYGFGIVLDQTFVVCGNVRKIDVMWNCHGHTTFQNLSTDFLEVVNESR